LHSFPRCSGWIACTSSHTEEEEEKQTAEGLFRILHATNGEMLTAASMVTAGGAAQWWVKPSQQLTSAQMGFCVATGLVTRVLSIPFFTPVLSARLSPFRCKALLWGAEASLRDMDAAADTVPAGSNGVIFLPHLSGERSPFTDPHARGAFLGLSAASCRDDLARAVLEGVAFNFKAIAHSLARITPLSTSIRFQLVATQRVSVLLAER
jgi:sugar (pentulose or hexulose) kinase